MGVVLHHEFRKWDGEWSRTFASADGPRFRIALGMGTETADGDASRATAIYLGTQFAYALNNPAFWSNPKLGGSLGGGEREFLTNALAQARAATAEEFRAADTLLHPQIAKAASDDRWMAPMIGFQTIAAMLLLCGLISLVATVALGQPPVLRLLGLMVVNRDGMPVSRLRVVWRWMVGWAPVLAVVSIFFFTVALATTAVVPGITPRTLKFPVKLSLLCLIGVLATLRSHPWRGWPDRLTGTYVVPQ